MKPSENLLILAGRVAQEGRWCKGGSTINDKGCLLHHLGKVLGVPPANRWWADVPYEHLIDTPEVRFLTEIIYNKHPRMMVSLEYERMITDNSDYVWTYNDHPKTTQRKCVDLCYEAAALAKEANQ